jgi:membrane-bound lytic murein transglycosylase F
MNNEAQIKDQHILHSNRVFSLFLYLCLLVVLTLIVLNAYKSSLEHIQAGGRKLTVITRTAPTTYYEGIEGKTGFEYDLAKLFAEHLNTELKIVIPDSFGSILPMVNGGQADFAAAGLTITEARKQLVRFGPPYQEIRQQLVYKSGKRNPPRSVTDIIGARIEVVAGTSFEERLKELKLQYPELTWQVNKELDIDQLLLMVAEDVIDYTIIDSNEFEFNQRFYPELRVAFDISEPQQLAWAFRKGQTHDDLYRSAVEFFAEIDQNGVLNSLLEKHYGYARQFRPVETTEYLRHVNNRLPTYKRMFMEAGQHYGFDWRLLAAVAYQESHWLTNAVSPTGVRGIMMLTERTARELGVLNRLDAQEAILGGARYLQTLRNNLPARIQEPDRTWMALAAYNVGAGHLEDARVITQSQGKNPDKWDDLKQFLPLLAKQKWYEKTRYGYARGWEPVIYVRNIRSYYDIMLWLDEHKPQHPPQVTPPNPYSIMPQLL